MYEQQKRIDENIQKNKENRDKARLQLNLQDKQNSHEMALQMQAARLKMAEIALNKQNASAARSDKMHPLPLVSDMNPLPALSNANAHLNDEGDMTRPEGKVEQLERNRYYWYTFKNRKYSLSPA